MERLTERLHGDGLCYGKIDCEDNCSYCDRFLKVLDKLAYYEDKEEQGLLISLPCKVGDTVYTACSWGVESGVVGNIEIIFDRIFVNNKNGAMIGEAHNIFLTRSEAEEALAKMGGK